jgi:hypothetical protein
MVAELEASGFASSDSRKNHNTRVILVAFKQRRKKMRQPLRRVGDPVTSIAALLVLATLGSLGLVVLALTLALGF